MKRLTALLLALMLVVSLAACGQKTEETPKTDAQPTAAPEATGAADAEATTPATEGGEQAAAQKYTIGICQFIPHPALDKATEGFMDAVKAELGEENVTFEVQDAAGEASNCSTIVNGLVASNVDLIMANATPAVAAAYNATEDIPILGTSVTEYGVALGIEGFNGVVGANVSGTSDLADLALQAKMVTEWVPNAKKVALLYCSAEANSQYQVDEVQKYLEEAGLECRQISFADTSDLMASVQEACSYADVIYVPTDNSVANNATAIDSVARPAGIPIIAGEAGICGGCGIATMSIDYYDLGYETGKMAVEILRDGADITQMAIRYAPEVTYQYNEEICTELGITPLEGYVKLEG